MQSLIKIRSESVSQIIIKHQHLSDCEPPFLAGERSAPLSVRLRRLGEAVWRSVTEARAASSGVTLPEDLRERIEVLEFVLIGAGNLVSRNTRSLLSLFPSLSMTLCAAHA